MKALRSLLIASLLAVATSAAAQDPSPYKFEFHGFVTGSLYMQDQTGGAGSGQGLIFFAPSPANHMPTLPTAGAGQKSGSFIGGDVRQSRYIFALSGPQVFGGATPKAYFEGDLFGGAGGTPLIESWVWRIRAAYAELRWGGTAFQAGQYAANLGFAQMPDSTAHIANPLSFGAGNFGWRVMGFRGYHTLDLGGPKLELALSVSGPKWGTDAVVGAAPTTVGAGQVSGMPALEFRAKVDGKAGNFGYSVYGDVFYQNADLKGFGGAGAGATLADGSVKTSQASSAYELGGKFTFAPVYLAFNVYSGEGMGAWAGALLQQGGIKEIGYWVSLGAFATKELSANVTYGVSAPDEKSVRLWATPFGNAAQKKENTLIAGQVKYSDGGYVLAAEYITYSTKYLQGTWAQYAAGTAAAAIKSDMYQVILTGGYFF